MKHYLLILFLIFSLPLMAAEKAEPCISFEEKAYDMGTIKAANGKVQHEFVFSNTGASPLVIKTAFGSCSCTVPTFPDAPIAPGEKGAIKVEYDPTLKSGEVSATISVLTNDPKHKRVTLRITGVVVPLK